MKTTYLYKLTACAYFSDNKAVSQQTRMTVERERERESKRKRWRDFSKYIDLVKYKINALKHSEYSKEIKWFKTILSYNYIVSLSKVFLHPYRNLRQKQLFCQPYRQLIALQIRLPVKDVPP